MITPYIKKHKKSIEGHIESFLQEKEREMSLVNSLGEEAVTRIHTATTGGKKLRGVLVLLASEMGGRTIDIDDIRIAAAVELFHTAFLIHDDIIDQDDMRHGQPAMHMQYRIREEQKNVRDPKALGNNMALCAGDMCLFFANELLGMVSTSGTSGQLVSLFSREFSAVALAEMYETYKGASDSPISLDEVTAIYRYKTARYTFSLPFRAGSILSNQDTSITNALDEIGELLGVLYQITDDELGLYGNEATIGKPVGSDIREGKKTIYYYYLFTKANANETKRLHSIMGNHVASQDEVEYVHTILKKYMIRQIVQKDIESRIAVVSGLIQRLAIPNTYRDMLSAILTYIVSRDR